MYISPHDLEAAIRNKMDENNRYSARIELDTYTYLREYETPGGTAYYYCSARSCGARVIWTPETKQRTAEPHSCRMLGRLLGYVGQLAGRVLSFFF